MRGRKIYRNRMIAGVLAGLLSVSSILADGADVWTGTEQTAAVLSDSEERMEDQPEQSEVSAEDEPEQSEVSAEGEPEQSEALPEGESEQRETLPEGESEQRETSAEGEPEQSEASLEEEWKQTEIATESQPEESDGQIESETDEQTEVQAEADCICGSKETELKHRWDCPVFQKAVSNRCSCGSEAQDLMEHEADCSVLWEAFAAACSGCMASKSGDLLHDDCQVVSCIHQALCDCGILYRNLEQAVDAHEKSSAFVQYIMRLSEYLNGQTDVIASDKGQMATANISQVSGWLNGDQVSSEYLAAKFYSGKSSFQVIGGSTESGRWIQGSTAKKSCQYWLPLQDNLSDRSSHGARYNHVIYDYKTGKWYDMQCTIQAYEKTLLPKSGETVYPYAGFYKNKLQFGFDRGGPMVIRCQIFETGTNKEAKIKVKIPVWDIDTAQYVGIKANNGTMDHRYYYSGADEWLRAKNNVSIAGVSGFYYVEGKYEKAADKLSTPQACAVWEMYTSDFSFALGYYNNATTAESTRQDRFDLFSTNTTIGDGSYGANGSYGVVMIYSKDNVAPVLQTPVKRASADGNDWKTNLTLPSTEETYTYAIDYTVLDTVSAYKFSSLILSDTLPLGLEYLGEVKVMRLEDQADKTGWFTAAMNNRTLQLTAAAEALEADDFYGYTYRAIFRVRMMPEILTPVYQNDESAVYTIVNTAAVSVNRNSKQTEKQTNAVSVTAPLAMTTLYVKKVSETTGELISDAEFHVLEWDGRTYGTDRGAMQYDTASGLYKMTGLRHTKTNGGKYKVTETGIPYGYTGSWEKEVTAGKETELRLTASNAMAMGRISIYKKNAQGQPLEGAVFQIQAKQDIVSPQGKVLLSKGTVAATVTADAEGKAVSEKLYPGTYLVTERKAPAGYARNSQAEEVCITYQGADIPIIQTEVTFVNEPLYSTICVTKEIDTADIVWAHGNPVFTFRIEGTDLFGNVHVYYDTVEFEQEQTGREEKTQKSITCKVPAGVYTVTEEQTARYQLEEIHSVINGMVSGKQAILDVAGRQDGTEAEGPVGSAVFYNQKVTDEDLTHTAFIRNKIGK